MVYFQLRVELGDLCLYPDSSSFLSSFDLSDQIRPVIWSLDRLIRPVHPKGDQSWVFIGRTDAETESAIRWPADAKN